MSENAKAREFFNRTVAQEPEFALAWAMLAWTHAFDAMNGWSRDREHSLARALEIAEAAITLEPALPLAYFVRGLVYRERREYVKALVEAERAIAYDANYSNAHVLLATLLYYAGRPEEGLRRIKKAMRLNPQHPFNYSFHLGQAFYILRRHGEAITAFKRGIASNPSSERLQSGLPPPMLSLAIWTRRNGKLRRCVPSIQTSHSRLSSSRFRSRKRTIEHTSWKVCARPV